MAPHDKIRRGDSREGVGWGDALGWDFVLRCPIPFLKSDQIVMCLISHTVASCSLNGPLLILTLVELVDSP